MAEVTQADRDAAAAYSKHWGRHAQAANVKRGTADNTFHLRLLARHREAAEAETVAKIVAWLRDGADDAFLDAAGCIEAGEWKIVWGEDE